MRRTLRIDSDACSGAGTCAALHPRLFRVDDGPSVPLLTALDDPADIAAALDAADVCPTGAIALTTPTPHTPPDPQRAARRPGPPRQS